MPILLRAALLAIPVLLLPRAAMATCGDGLLEPSEECDDLNTTAGDGCDAACAIEDGWECADASFALDFAEELITSDSTHSSPTWSLSADGTTLTQSLNALPAVYASTLPAVGVSMTFELRVNTTSDDDFIGWAIGYDPGEGSSPSADWLLFDWKQGDQNWEGYDAWAGLRMYRVTGAIDDSHELWGHIDDVHEVAQALSLGSTGWAGPAGRLGVQEGPRLYYLSPPFSPRTLRPSAVSR
jgi:cysteine-rich repeat protein